MSCPSHYEVYGLVLSSSVALPGFPLTCDSGNADIELMFGAEHLDLSKFDHIFELSYTTAGRISSPTFEPIENDGCTAKMAYRIRYWGGGEFVVSANGSHIWVPGTTSTNFETLLAYLSGPVLGFALRLRGVLCLHASVIEVDGHAIALMAPSGGGKSTTAAAMATLGHLIVSDDVLVTHTEEGCIMAQPGFPWLRLYDDSAEQVLTGHVAASHTTRQGDKNIVRLTSSGFRRATASLPLVALYVALSTESELSITPLSGSQSLLTVLGNTYPGPHYRLQKTHRAAELHCAQQLLRGTALRGLHYQRDLSQLPALCAALVQDARKQISLRSLSRRNAQSSIA